MGMKGAQAVKKETEVSLHTSSHQNKARTFMRHKLHTNGKIKKLVGKTVKLTKDVLAKSREKTSEALHWTLKHPKRVALATAITVMLLTPVKTSAQDISGKTELVSDKEPTDKTPLSMQTVAGTNTINLGNGKEISVSELKRLGAEAFDGTEEHLVQKSKTEGWLHFFFNEKWDGYLLVSEKIINGGLRAGAVLLPEGKLFNPLVMIKDEFQNFVLIGTKGIYYSVDGDGGFMSLTTRLGVDELQDAKLEENKTSGKNVTTLRFGNSSGRLEFYYDKNDKLEDFKIFDGVAISQR